MPTKAELTKYIKDYKKKNCPPYSSLKKKELEKLAKEMGYGQEKEREVKISGDDLLHRIRDLTEASKSRMQKRSENKQAPKRPTPKKPKKSKEELMNELKARRKQLFKEFIQNGEKIRELPESRAKEGKKLLKQNEKIREALNKISEAFKKINLVNTT